MGVLRVILVLVSLAFGGCAAPPPAPPSVASGPELPIGHYAQALARGEAVYRIATNRSEILVRAYRGGALARFGHDHVISGRDVRGYIVLTRDLQTARADLSQPLAAMYVDEPSKRAQAGFDTQPSAQDIEGTRRNMLDKVLEADRYPSVYLRVARAEGETPRLTLRVALTLHGMTREIPVEVDVERMDAGGLDVRGRFSIKQTDFGITPFSVLGGALQVQDQLDVDFDVRAERVPPGATLPPA